MFASALRRIPGSKGVEVSSAFHQTRCALLRFCLPLAMIDPEAQGFAACIDTGPQIGSGEFYASEARVVQRPLRYLHRGGRIGSDPPLFPKLIEMEPPGLLKTPKEQVWTAKEEYPGCGRVALGQRAEILVDDGFEQAGHDLIDRHPRLDQGIGIRLGKDAALRADSMQVIAVIPCLSQALGGHLELARRLLNECASTTTAG